MLKFYALFFVCMRIYEKYLFSEYKALLLNIYLTTKQHKLQLRISPLVFRSSVVSEPLIRLCRPIEKSASNRNGNHNAGSSLNLPLTERDLGYRVNASLDAPNESESQRIIRHTKVCVQCLGTAASVIWLADMISIDTGTAKMFCLIEGRSLDHTGWCQVVPVSVPHAGPKQKISSTFCERWKRHELQYGNCVAA